LLRDKSEPAYASKAGVVDTATALGKAVIDVKELLFKRVIAMLCSY
jgi:hypothetical protein